MRLNGRPLLDNAADQALFVGRDAQLRAIKRSVRSGLSCLVAGEPGSGKTSLVRAAMFGSLGDPVHFSYARAGSARSVTELLTAVLTAIPAPPAESLRATSRQRVPGDLSPIELIDELAEVIANRREIEPGTQVIAVDDVLASAGFEAFGAWRDELWQVDAVWLVTTSSAQVSGLLRAPADVFFETSLELGALSAAEAAELLRRRTDDLPADDQAELIAAALAAGPATPRRLLDAARELAAGPAVGAERLNTVSGLKARAEALERVSRPARMLAAELDALGWASASDERLLDRMGWTRPRVVQVIAELESGGLVQMREESSGRGRPRKLYRLTPAAEFADPNRTDPNGTDPNGTDPGVTDPNGSSPRRTDPRGTDPNGSAASGTDQHGTGPTKAGPHETAEPT